MSTTRDRGATPEIRPQEVAVAVATYRRPHLLRACLESLRDIDPSPKTVIVVDNDSTGLADPDSLLPAAATWQLEYIHEPVPGISAARNAAVRRAMGIGVTWLAFIDDDEVADKKWLGELLSSLTRSAADAASGSVEVQLEQGGRQGITADDFRKPVPADGTQLRFASTANLVVSVDALRGVSEDGAVFDVGLGMIGGSDTFLTARLSSLGCTIVASPGAVVTETIPAERQTFGWLRRRRMRQAGIYVEVQRRVLRDRWWRLRRIASALRDTTGGATLWLIGWFDRTPVRRERARVVLARGWGTWLGLAGRLVAEYERNPARD